jgi:hypothetical protein
MPVSYIVSRSGNAFKLVNPMSMIAPHSESLNFRHDEAFTFEGWIYGLLGAGVVFFNKTGSMSAVLNPQGRLRFRLQSTNGDLAFDSVTFTPIMTFALNNRWSHIAITKSSGYGSVGNYKLYINGVSQSVYETDFSTPLLSTSDITNTSDFIIGGSAFSAWYHSLRLHKGEATVEMINKLIANDGAKAVVPNCVAEYLFAEGSITNWTDTSGYGNHAARSGAAATENKLATLVP